MFENISSPRRNGVTAFRDRTALPAARYLASVFDDNPNAIVRFTYYKSLGSLRSQTHIQKINIQSSFDVSLADIRGLRLNNNRTSLHDFSFDKRAAISFTKKIVEGTVRDTLRTVPPLNTGYYGFDAFCGISRRCSGDEKSPLVLIFGTEQQEEDYITGQRYYLVLSLGVLSAGPVGAASAASILKIPVGLRSLSNRVPRAKPAVPTKHVLSEALERAAISTKTKLPTTIKVNRRGETTNEFAIYVRTRSDNLIKLIIKPKTMTRIDGNVNFSMTNVELGKISMHPEGVFIVVSRSGVGRIGTLETNYATINAFNTAGRAGLP